MLSCIYNGKPFIASDKSLSIKQKYELADQKQFLCPCCRRPVFYCHEGLRIAHFNHYEVGDCPEGTLRSYDFSNTSKHERLTEIFVDWIKAQFPDINVIPDFLVNRELKTDIYFKLGNKKIAIEIQFKRVPNPNFIKRRELYKKNGITDIWFFVTEEEFYPVGSPFHKTYYHNNRRELYFYQSPKLNCKIYKGFAKEKWEKVGTNTLDDYVVIECDFNRIKIGNNGRLIIPSLQAKYFSKLKEKREKLKQDRELRKKKQEDLEALRNAYNERVNKTKNVSPNFWENPGKGEQQRNPNYNRPTTNYTKPEKVIIEGSLLDKVQKYNKIMQGKPYTQEYKEYHFVNENGKEYLDITFFYQGMEYKKRYEIVKNQCTKNKEYYLTCRKPNEPDNIKYQIEINPFLDSMKKIRIQKYEFC